MLSKLANQVIMLTGQSAYYRRRSAHFAAMVSILPAPVSRLRSPLAIVGWLGDPDGQLTCQRIDCQVAIGFLFALVVCPFIRRLTWPSKIPIR